MRRLRKEEYLKKTENLDSARTWRLESQWHVVDSHSAAVCCCSRPMVGVVYKAVPVLADEDKIGGSAIGRLSDLLGLKLQQTAVPGLFRATDVHDGVHLPVTLLHGVCAMWHVPETCLCWGLKPERPETRLSGTVRGVSATSCGPNPMNPPFACTPV